MRSFSGKWFAWWKKLSFNCYTLVLSEWIYNEYNWKRKDLGKSESMGISRRPAVMRNLEQRISWAIWVQCHSCSEILWLLHANLCDLTDIYDPLNLKMDVAWKGKSWRMHSPDCRQVAGFMVSRSWCHKAIPQSQTVPGRKTTPQRLLMTRRRA